MLSRRQYHRVLSGNESGAGRAGFLLAAVYSSTLLTSGYATGKQHIPLGPFMLAGASAVILTWPCRFPFPMSLSRF
jgi:hypothetical protein